MQVLLQRPIGSKSITILALVMCFGCRNESTKSNSQEDHASRTSQVVDAERIKEQNSSPDLDPFGGRTTDLSRDPFAEVDSGDGGDILTEELLTDLIEGDFDEFERLIKKTGSRQMNELRGPDFDPPISSAEKDRIVISAIESLLTEPGLDETRNAYTSKATTEVFLHKSSTDLDWPKTIPKRIGKFNIHHFDQIAKNSELRGKPAIVLQFSELDLIGPYTMFMGQNIVIVLSGANQEEPVLGGASIYFNVNRKGKGFLVYPNAVLDP